MANEDLMSELDYPVLNSDPTKIYRETDARELPIRDNTVNLVVTSPPYYQKRDYGVEEQIGQEESPELYAESLIEALTEWKRVLRPTGSVVLNLGDTYNDKTRIGIPWKVAQKAREHGWSIRSEIIWSKPNGVPDPAEDRLTPRHETVFHLTPRKTGYYFDKHGFSEVYGNRRDVWEISHDRNEDHLAPFPKELAKRSIMMACPPGVCPECNAPLERQLVKTTRLDEDRPQAARAMDLFNDSDLTEQHIKAIQAVGIADVGKGKEIQNRSGKNADSTIELANEAKEVLGGYFREFTFPIKEMGGWESCECDTEPVPSVVLDPFMGSGTVIDVAHEMGRVAVGTDLDLYNEEQSGEFDQVLRTVLAQSD